MSTSTFSATVLAAMLSAAWPAWGVQHMDLDVSVDPAGRTLSASASITTEAPELRFYLADNFIVESVEADGATIPAGRTSLDGLQHFQIDLPDAETPSTVTVRYHGDLQPLDTSMSHDDTLNGLPAMSSETGSYLPGGSGWHPVPAAAFTYRLRSKVPSGYVAVAPGVPADEAQTDSVRQASFTMEKAVDGIDLMVGKWVISERIVRIAERNIRLRTYFGESEISLSNDYLDATQRFIERYSGEIGPYPFGIFSVVSSPIPTGFGMPTLTYLGKAVLHYPFIRDISLGHEVLHSWWGNGVRVDTGRGNWAEGLTTFMADYAYREDEGPRAAMRMRHGWLRDYAALAPGSERPLSAFRARHHTASAVIGYGKAAMMYYELRNRLGEDTFMQGIRGFWTEHRGGTAGFDELRAAFEKAGNTDLAGFFDQWLERTGAPRIRVASARLANTAGTELELELVQTAGANESEPFGVSVPLRVLSGNVGSDVRFELPASRRKAKIAIEARPTSLQIDPAFEIWRKLLPEETPPIFRDVIAAELVQVLALEPEMQAGAMAFTRAFSEGQVLAVKSGNQPTADRPLIIAGSKPGVVRHLKSLGRAARPDVIENGVAEVWIAPDPGRQIVVIAIDTADRNAGYLERLGRRLRHLGSYSWVSIADQGTTRHGNWPAETPRIPIPE